MRAAACDSLKYWLLFPDGMEINIDNSQVLSVSRSNDPLQIKVNNRELKEVDHF